MKSIAVHGFAGLRGIAAISIAVGLVACGGKTGGGPGSSGSGGGNSGSSSGGGVASSSGSGGGGVTSGSSSGGSDGSPVGGETCIDIPASGFDTSCQSDSDCTAVETGQVCSDTCYCSGNTPINVAGRAAWQNDIAVLPPGTTVCSCPPAPPPRCFGGTCAFTGVGTADAGACVDIPASTYSTACTSSVDCTTLPVGQVCSGTCIACEGIPVNIMGTFAFDNATAGLTFAQCFCAANPVACVGGVCVQCPSPGGCPDGG